MSVGDYKGISLFRYEETLPFYKPLVPLSLLQWRDSGVELRLGLDSTGGYSAWQRRETINDNYSSSGEVFSPIVQWGRNRLGLIIRPATRYSFSIDGAIPHDDPTTRVPQSADPFGLGMLGYVRALEEMSESPIDEVFEDVSYKVCVYTYSNVAGGMYGDRINVLVDSGEKVRSLANRFDLDSSGTLSVVQKRIEVSFLEKSARVHWGTEVKDVIIESTEANKKLVFQRLNRAFGLSDSDDVDVLRARIERRLEAFRRSPGFTTLIYELGDKYYIWLAKEMRCKAKEENECSYVRGVRLCKPKGTRERKMCEVEFKKKVSIYEEAYLKDIDLNLDLLFEPIGVNPKEANHKKLLLIEVLNYLIKREAATTRESIGFYAGGSVHPSLLDFRVPGERHSSLGAFYMGKLDELPFFLNLAMNLSYPDLHDGRGGVGRGYHPPGYVHSYDELSHTSQTNLTFAGAFEYQFEDEKLIPSLMMRFIPVRKEEIEEPDVFRFIDPHPEDNIGSDFWLAGALTYHVIKPEWFDEPHTLTLDSNLYTSLGNQDGHGNEAGARVTGSFMWNFRENWTFNSALSFVGVKPWGDSRSYEYLSSQYLYSGDEQDRDEKIGIRQMTKRVHPNYRYAGLGTSLRTSVAWRILDWPLFKLNLGAYIGGDYLSENGGFGVKVGLGLTSSTGIGFYDQDFFSRHLGVNFH